jgi:hypothetical protein
LLRRCAPVVVAGLVLAGCGGSHMASTTNAFSGYPRTQIIKSYETFFAGSTPLARRVALLQNGSRFKQVIRGFASNPLAKNVSVKVISVRPRGADDANVVYVVKLGGAALPKQTGTAVRQSGAWKVGDASLCKLVALQGSTPSVCKS